jgi:dihydroorotase
MTESILIKNGRVIDPGQGIDSELDLLIVDGKISSLSKTATKAIPTGCEIFDAKGLIVTPGLIDLHTHLRDPGMTNEETIASGTAAAAAGGFTTVVCMANTTPVIDNTAVVEYVISKAKSEGVVNVLPVGAITKGLKGEEITEMGRLLDAGAVAFSDDGRPVMNADVMRRAMEYSKQFKTVLLCHSEDANLSFGGVMNEGALSTMMGLKGIPKAAEEIAIDRDIRLAKEFDARIHICHVSTAGSVELVRRAKEDGVKVTCETAPHYFTLTEGEVEGYNTNAKMNPPLRSEEDIKAILKGLKDGTIDCIATDHAPHLIEEKNVEFRDAAFGIVGLETALSLVLTELVDAEALTLSKTIEKLTSNPAKVLSKKTGTFMIGYPGDVTIIDLKKPVTVNSANFYSKSSNTPYDGWKLKGAPVATIVAGKIVMKDGKVLRVANPSKAPLPKFININPTPGRASKNG